MQCLWRLETIVEGHMEIYCTCCCAEKSEVAGLLLAIKRYVHPRIGMVDELANRAGRRMFVLSGEFGLLGRDEEIPWYDHLLGWEEVSGMVTRVAERLEREGVRRLVFFSQSVEEDPHLGPYQELLMEACARAGVELELRAEPKGSY